MQSMVLHAIRFGHHCDVPMAEPIIHVIYVFMLSSIFGHGEYFVNLHDFSESFCSRIKTIFGQMCYEINKISTQMHKCSKITKKRLPTMFENALKIVKRLDFVTHVSEKCFICEQTKAISKHLYKSTKHLPWPKRLQCVKTLKDSTQGLPIDNNYYTGKHTSLVHGAYLPTIKRKSKRIHECR